MKLGLFGGSFDPVHAGHLRPVIEARRRLGLDRVIYLPTANPPHKTGRAMTPALQRLAMVELALLDEQNLVVDGHEIVGRPSYTVETLEHFRTLWPETQLHLLIGADSLAQLDRWRRWQELPRLARLVVLARPGWDLETIRPELPSELGERLTAGEIDVIEDELVDLSSTQLRESFAEGARPNAGEIPALVLDYIHKYSLYRPPLDEPS